MRRLALFLLALAAPAALSAQVRLYADEFAPDPFDDIQYGWDLGDGTAVSSLTPEGFATIGELANGTTLWDFSGVGPGVPTASTSVPIVASETCNAESCGYNPGGAFTDIRILSREDWNFVDPGALEITNAVQEYEERAADTVVWLRAGAQREGKEGALGDGESRFCYWSEGGETRTPAMLWRFDQEDASGRRYLQAPTSWTSDPFDCEQNVFNQVCGQPGPFFDELWVQGCDDHTGTQSVDVLGDGTAVLPSGHMLDVVLARTIADFCVYLADGCSGLFKTAEVRTVVYLWVNPLIGTVVRLQSAQEVPDATSFTTLSETDIKFGLLPPLAIDPPVADGTSVTLTWNPGLVTDFIDGYKIYWDTDSGADTAYAFDSETNPGQVAIDTAGASAVVSGLEPDTTYYFTVTSLSSYTDPTSGETTRYESLLFPRQLTGGGEVYPVEVQATTGTPPCVPGSEVQGLRLARLPADPEQVTFCWQAMSDPCLESYRLRVAPGPESAVGFEILDQVAPGAPDPVCHARTAPAGYFLVTGIGPDGEGPWGHYGR